jgi:protein-L-isoaspartate(D-aspartate) O-methyltransferase
MSGSTPRRGRFPLSLDKVAAGGKSAPARELLRPQAPLDQAVREAARVQAPAGVGLDSAAVRARMVERLRADGVTCEPVLQAMLNLPRHGFVESALVPQAYEDTSLPIGHGQTISKPSVVARMLALLFEGANARAARSLGRTLEIGTGCGYQAALLAMVSRSVVSIERIAPLYDKARDNLAALRHLPMRLVLGDGMLGHPPNAPYDSIIAAASGESLPEAWLDQLAVGGRLVAPVADAAGRGQVLLVVDRDESGVTRSFHEAVRFVPLKSGVT